MRIEAYTQIQQLYKTNKAQKSQKNAGVSGADQLQISSLGKEFQLAKAAVAGSPDIRDEVTAPIKEKIQKGAYEVGSESFAERLLGRFQEMR